MNALKYWNKTNNYIQRLYNTLLVLLIPCSIIGYLFLAGSSTSPTLKSKKNNTTPTFKNCLKNSRNTTPPIALSDTLKTNIEKGNIEVFTTSKEALSENKIIPSLILPKFSSTEDIKNCLPRDQKVLLVTHLHETKLYPANILEKHIVINDKIANTPVVITYSPFANTSTVHVKKEDENFQASNRILYGISLIIDEQTHTIWNHISGKAVLGDRTGETLELLPSNIITYEKALDMFPKEKILNFDTEYAFDYDLEIYKNYHDSNNIPTQFNWSDENEPKTFSLNTRILGIDFNNLTRAYDIALLENQDIKDKLGNSILTIKNTPTGYKVEIDKEPYPFVETYWNMWIPTHPKSEFFYET